MLSGALEHRDSLGNGEVLRPGEVQHMTAGTGIRHSEFNPSATEAVHLYQIWLLPERERLTLSYGQKAFPAAERNHRWQLVASPDGRDGSLTIHQDAQLYLAALSEAQELRHDLTAGRHARLQVLSGAVVVNGAALAAGDGAALSEEASLSVRAVDAAEVLLFDLA